MFSAKCKEKGTAIFIITSSVDNSNDVYHNINDVTNVPVCLRLKQDYIKFFLQTTLGLLLKLTSKIWFHLVSNLQRYDTISAHVPKRVLQFASEKTSVYWSSLYIRVCNSRKIVSVSLCLVPF